MGNTLHRSYPKPVPTNAVSDDVNVLMQTFDLIDSDMDAVMSSNAGKAPVVHSHVIADVSGLQSALDGKLSSSASFSLDDLSDVSGAAGAANGYILVKGAGGWTPASASSAIGAHTHAITDVTGLQTALDSKLAVTDLAAAATKTTPVDTDTMPLNDSAASNALKKVSWANIKATLKNYFDTLYASAAYGVPVGTVLEFAGAIAPSGFLFCDGAAYSRTTYSALFAQLGTTHGVGDGSTTFNVPDRRDRVAIGRGDMGGTAANRMGASLSGTRASTANGIITALSSTAGLSVGMLAFGTGIGTGAVIASIDSSTQVTLSVNNTATGTAAIRFAVVDSVTVGASGGAATHTLSTAQMPSHTHSLAEAMPAITNAAGSVNRASSNTPANVSGTSGATGGGQAHPIVQPSIVMNYIIKT